jgi:hypothetical protein
LLWSEDRLITGLRRFAQLSVVAVLLALAIPGSAPAAVWYDGPYEWGIGHFVCHQSGGRFGYGYMQVQGGISKYGRVGVNYFKIEFTRQWTEGSTWHQDRQYMRESAHFPDDSTTHSYLPRWTFPFTADEAGRTFRFQLKYTWMHERFGPDTAKKKHVAYYGPCVGGDGQSPAPGVYALAAPR